MLQNAVSYDEAKLTHIKSNTPRLQADNHDFWLLRRFFEPQDSGVLLLHIHGPIESIVIIFFPLQHYLYEIQETCELRKNDSAKRWVVFLQPPYFV